MKTLANFAEASLSRAEMKSLVGGNCYYNTSSGVQATNSLSSAKAFASWNTGQYCCASCSTASWCHGC